MFTIYKIIDITKNKPVYVGKTNNFKKRIREHRCLSSTGCKVLNRAFNKYGLENYSFIKIKSVKTNAEACKLEKEYIKIYNTKVPNGYNLTDGGEGTLGYSPSDETRKLMSDKKIGIKLSDKHKSNISKGLLNSKLFKESHNTLEHKKNKSNRMKGNTYWLGKSHKKSTKEKIGKATEKTFTLRSPTGEEVTFTNMTKFCKINNLNNVSLSRVASGKQKQHKGWTLN